MGYLMGVSVFHHPLGIFIDLGSKGELRIKFLRNRIRVLPFLRLGLGLGLELHLGVRVRVTYWHVNKGWAAA